MHNVSSVRIETILACIEPRLQRSHVGLAFCLVPSGDSLIHSPANTVFMAMARKYEEPAGRQPPEKGKDDDMEDSLDDTELLQRIREIAALDDATALDELDELVSELRFGVDWQRQRVRDVLARLRAESELMAKCVERNVPLDSWWSGRELLRRLGDFDSRWTEDMRKQIAGDIAEVRHASEPIAKAGAAYGAASLISESLKEPIANTMVAERILRDLTAAEAVLVEAGALGAHAMPLRRARERAARYRWQRKIDEAEVVDAGGNSKKAARLRAEAAVMLKQDWLRAFPDESPPAA